MMSLLEESISEVAEEEIVSNATRCLNCNVCFTQCPLDRSLVPGYMASGPSGLVQSIYYALKWDLFGEKEREELLRLLYACTTCNGCVLTCRDTSTGIAVLRAIEQGRRLLVEKGIGPLPTQRGVLKSIYVKGNPYNLPPEDRLKWLGNQEVKLLPGASAAYLYYVGCTASYDPELQDVARSLVGLLRRANLDFGLLKDERCCGCAAKRLGDVYLFHDIAGKNIATFRETGVGVLLTTSPHCFNTFYREYGPIGNIEVRHYTQVLLECLRTGKLTFGRDLDLVVTYHDPCYLAKHNGIVSEPRELLARIPKLRLVEMEDNGTNGLCCGGGGGRVWCEVAEERRLANLRVEQALATGAQVLAVACPWCFSMLNTAVKDLEAEERIRVMDITQILTMAL